MHGSTSTRPLHGRAAAQATADAEQKFAGLLGQWRRRRAGWVGTPARYHFACPVYGCSVDQQGMAWRGVPFYRGGGDGPTQLACGQSRAASSRLVCFDAPIHPPDGPLQDCPPINKWGSRRSLITAPIKKKVIRAQISVEAARTALQFSRSVLMCASLVRALVVLLLGRELQGWWCGREGREEEHQVQ